MQEKRKQKRYPTDISLTIETLYKQSDDVLKDVNSGIVLTDISRTGVGFECDSDLPLDYYFNAKIEIQEKKHFYTVVKIIRKEQEEDRYLYGCEFVGLADVLSVFVEDYGHELDL